LPLGMRFVWLEPVWEGSGHPTIVTGDKMSWTECKELLDRLNVNVPSDLGIHPSDEMFCTVENFD